MRVTTAHWQVFLEIAGKYPELITSKFNGPQGKAQGNELWKNVAARLNGLGYGEKTIGEWRRALTDWKSKVKLKASKLQNSLSMTGGGQCDTPPLTELEEKLLSLMGRKSLEGDNVRELGECSSKKNKNIETLHIMGTDIDKESNLDFEVIDENIDFEECLEYPTEHNYAHDIAFPNKGIEEQHSLKRDWHDEHPSTSQALKSPEDVLNKQRGSLLNKKLAKSTPKTPMSLPLTSSSNFLSKPSTSSSMPPQKKRKISSIPKIGKNLENLTSESVETFRNIAGNCEAIAKNSSRIANSLEELALYFKNTK